MDVREKLVDLKPCPFCGGNVRFDEAYSYFRDIIKDQQEFFDFRSRYPDIRYHGYDKAGKGVEGIGWDIL